MIKLHLGCGKKILPGFLHIDIIPFDHLDYVYDISNLDFIESLTIDEIYASHVLEHFNRKKIMFVLKEWNRLLVNNGILRLAVPDFSSIVEQYNENKNVEELEGLLYGGQTYEYNFHHITFDIKYISKLLTEAGFTNISTYDWRDFLPEEYDDYSRAYLPHMNQNGRLMSLNIIAYKTEK